MFYLTDVFKRLSVDHIGELRGLVLMADIWHNAGPFGPLSVGLVLQHLWVLYDGGGELGLHTGDG